jgi:hypothetical protein
MQNIIFNKLNINELQIIIQVLSFHTENEKYTALLSIIFSCGIFMVCLNPVVEFRAGPMLKGDSHDRHFRIYRIPQAAQGPLQ